MQRLEVSGVVRLIYRSLGVKRLNLPEAEERKLCPLRYYANCVSTTLTVLILHNVESVCFFYSNPVLFLKMKFSCFQAFGLQPSFLSKRCVHRNIVCPNIFVKT